jgi:putative ABC transport system permease protein
LDQLPATYITSFRLSEAEKPKATALVKAFPTLTMIDVDQLLKQAEELIQKLSDSASFIMGLTVLCGLILVIATLQQDLAKRQFETALLRTLGASSEQTKRLNHLEYILMGFSCGVLAAVLSELVLLGIYLGPLELEPTLHPSLWILLPVVGTLLFTLTGSLIRKGMDVQQSFAYLKQRED